MQLNKLVKAMLIALPVMALTACDTTTKIDEGQTEQNQSNQTTQTETVQVETVKREKTPEEIQQERNDALRQEQVVYFDFDKASVSSEYAELLQAHADYLVKNGSVKVLIEGHADERGTPEYNIALGERRAKAVSKYLQSLGVTEGQISLVSYGEEKPMVKTRTEDAFSKNRRAVLVY